MDGLTAHSELDRDLLPRPPLSAGAVNLRALKKLNEAA